MNKSLVTFGMNVFKTLANKKVLLAVGAAGATVALFSSCLKEQESEVSPYLKSFPRRFEPIFDTSSLDNAQKARVDSMIDRTNFELDSLYKDAEDHEFCSNYEYVCMDNTKKAETLIQKAKKFISAILGFDI